MRNIFPGSLCCYPALTPEQVMEPDGSVKQQADKFLNAHKCSCKQEAKMQVLPSIAYHLLTNSAIDKKFPVNEYEKNGQMYVKC